jgi:hypothetical protein
LCQTPAASLCACKGSAFVDVAAWRWRRELQSCAGIRRPGSRELAAAGGVEWQARGSERSALRKPHAAVFDAFLLQLHRPRVLERAGVHHTPATGYLSRHGQSSRAWWLACSAVRLAACLARHGHKRRRRSLACNAECLTAPLLPKSQKARDDSMGWFALWLHEVKSSNCGPHGQVADGTKHIWRQGVGRVTRCSRRL